MDEYHRHTPSFAWAVYAVVSFFLIIILSPIVMVIAGFIGQQLGQNVTTRAKARRLGLRFGLALGLSIAFLWVTTLFLLDSPADLKDWEYLGAVFVVFSVILSCIGCGFGIIGATSKFDHAL